MTTETETRTGPAYWASYLINGDASGITELEALQCDSWVEHLALDGWRVVDCSGESYFSPHNDASSFTDKCAGDCVSYVLMRSV